jgi:hypothetical protein
VVAVSDVRIDTHYKQQMLAHSFERNLHKSSATHFHDWRNLDGKKILQKFDMLALLLTISILQLPIALEVIHLKF